MSLLLRYALFKLASDFLCGYHLIPPNEYRSCHRFGRGKPDSGRLCSSVRLDLKIEPTIRCHLQEPLRLAGFMCSDSRTYPLHIQSEFCGLPYGTDALRKAGELGCRYVLDEVKEEFLEFSRHIESSGKGRASVQFCTSTFMYLQKRVRTDQTRRI